MGSTAVADSIKEDLSSDPYANRKGDDFSKMDKRLAIDMMTQEMLEAAENLDFERAAHLRDEVEKMKKEIEKVF